MPKKVLFVCTVNRFRSKTAEEIFKSKFNVKSAGTSELANTPLSRELLEWADYIFVMEESHKNCGMTITMIPKHRLMPA